MYVSLSTLEDSHAASEVAEIVERSITRNATLAISGALIFTGAHFAQALEGSGPNIDVLMSSIRRDERHTRVTIVDRSQISRRRFESWQMAYQGLSRYVDSPLERLLEAPQIERSRHVERIYQMMREFTRD